jgi:hypothetical protein
MIIPYNLLLANIRSDGDDVIISREFLEFLLRQILPQVDFDEENYLRANPDVAAAIRRGEWRTPRDHFVAVGYFENRDGAAKPLSEVWYQRVNSDVAEAIKAGEWTSGDHHYREKGLFEWRAPNKELREVFALWRSELVSDMTSHIETLSINENDKATR